MMQQQNRALLHQLESIEASSLTLKEINFFMKHRLNKTTTILKFIIMEKLDQLLSPQSIKIRHLFEKLTNMIDFLSCYEENVAKKQTDFPIIEFLELMQQVRIAEDFSREMKKVARFVNKKGYSIQELFDLFDTLEQDKSKRCWPMTRSTIPASLFVESKSIKYANCFAISSQTSSVVRKLINDKTQKTKN